MDRDFVGKLLEALDQMEQDTIAAFFGRMVTLRAMKAEAEAWINHPPAETVRNTGD